VKKKSLFTKVSLEKYCSKMFQRLEEISCKNDDIFKDLEWEIKMY
jgi:hypothetical protein